jgi:hypothetical protein
LLVRAIEGNFSAEFTQITESMVRCAAYAGAGVAAASSVQCMLDLAAVDIAASPAMVILPSVAILAG